MTRQDALKLVDRARTQAEILRHDGHLAYTMAGVAVGRMEAL